MDCQLRALIFSDSPEVVRRFRNLAECVGISLESAEDTVIDRLNALIVGAEKKTGAIVIDIGAMGNRFGLEKSKELITGLMTIGIPLLLLVSQKGERTHEILLAVTDGAISGTTIVELATYLGFPKESASLSSELSSYSYSRAPQNALALNVSETVSVSIIMTLSGTPAFARLDVGNQDVFVWSSTEIFDVLTPIAAENEFELAADKYIPPIIFLRFAFREHCWHNPCPGAGIVIDDPLLRRCYGFIQFPRLLASARKNSYHITLAFIPWNYWRSRKKRAKPFLDYADCFSLCAHGCDHTNHEFRSRDYQDLLSRNFEARRRMTRHEERTGLFSEPLMVCPQEQYSLEAMRAFADSRQFAGLLCTACMPRNLAEAQLCGADLLLPAQDSFYGFPVFKRHYWDGMAVFAMALFLGKPAILVEHHEFFRDGSAGAEQFSRSLAALRPEIKWTSLAETVTRTHIRRRLSKGEWEVRFFSDTFRFEHTEEKAVDYRLFRRVSDATAVERVLVNGEVVPFVKQQGFLFFDFSASNAQTILVQVEVPPVQPTLAYATGAKYQFFVAVRRVLSEFRDNVVARNSLALKAGKLLMRSLKQTGE